MRIRKPGTKNKRPMKAVAKPRQVQSGKTAALSGGSPASQLIDQRIRELKDWRGETLARMRTLLRQTNPGIVEEWKWAVPVWSRQGIICTGEVYKQSVKLTFARGAKVPDPSRLFNSSLEGSTRRAIDIHEGDKLDVRAFKALIRAAVALNGQMAKKR